MAAGEGLIKKRRRLDDLFRQGVEVRIGGRYGLEGAVAQIGDSEPPEDLAEHLHSSKGRFLLPATEDDESTEIAMWVQPPSPLNREQALRDANAARARAVLVAKSDDQSPEYYSAMEFITTMSEDTLYEYVLLSGTDERRQDALREILADDEWSDITELQESMRIFEEEKREDDDPEVKAVRKREEDLSAQVVQREKELREAALQVLKMGGKERAEKEALEKRGEIIGSQAFMREYERQMQFYAVRDVEAQSTFFFESPADLADRPEAVRDLVMRALSFFIQDGAEAKN